jgi:hypothetical protein
LVICWPLAVVSKQPQSDGTVAMKTLIARILPLFLLPLSFGCSSVTPASAVIGTWECQDLRAVEHVSQFKSDTLIIKPDGTYLEFLTDRGGTRLNPSFGRYTIVGRRIELGGHGSWYVYSIKGATLSLTVEKATNPEDVGLVLNFRRK